MPELRIDPVCGRRVYVAEDRAGRPCDYLETSSIPQDAAAAAARRERCPFCAGHESATPDAIATVVDAADSWRVRVVPNKFPAVAPLGTAAAPLAAGGAHEVIIESPQHLLDWVQMDARDVAAVLGVYRDRLRHWAADRRLRHATIFKNSGFAAGASLEHVHSQLIALPDAPPAVQAELDGAERFRATHGRCVFCDLIARETAGGERLVARRGECVAVCAYAGRQPYETWVIPDRHAARFEMVDDAELAGIAEILQDVIRGLYDVSAREAASLAYNLILHTGPFGDDQAESYHWHWEVVPRSTQLAGFEWGAAVFINPISPERAARDLRGAIGPGADPARSA